MSPDDARTTDDAGWLARLEGQLQVIMQRLERLEGDQSGIDRTQRTANGSPTEPDGTMAFSASIRWGERRFRTTQELDLAQTLQANPEIVARLFAALGSPFRIRLLRALLEGPRTSRELQAALEVGPVGQLYHHLKELLLAGLIIQPRRNVYAIREETVVPILLAFAVAPRVASQRGPTKLDEDQITENR